MTMPPTSSWVPDLDRAINREPLTTSPTALLTDVVNLISQAHSQICSLNEDFLSLNASESEVNISASCILVLQDRHIVGILTERDIVRLTAEKVDFATVSVDEVMVKPVVTLPQHSLQDIFAVLFLFRRYRIRHLPIVDRHEKLIGVISHESIRQVLRPANLLRFRRVVDVMTSPVIHAPLIATVLEVGQLMAKYRVSCVVITQEDEYGNIKPVGLVTDGDMLQFQALQIDLAKTLVETIMTTPLFLLKPEDSLWTAHQEMQKRGVGRLVVSWNWGQNLGIVTQSDLLKIFDPIEMYGVIENLQRTVNELETKTPSSSVDSDLSLASQPKLHETLDENRPQQTNDQHEALALESTVDLINQNLQSLLDFRGDLTDIQNVKLQELLNVFHAFKASLK